MGLFERMFGDQRRRAGASPEQPGARASDDQAAIARYRYLVRTAPPEAIEEAHAEAFARLSPEQRRQVLQELGAELPAGERAFAERAGDDPRSLARVATRAELTRPGTLERAFDRVGPAGRRGGGVGGLMAGSFLSAIAGSVLGTAIAQQFLDADVGEGGFAGHETGDGGFDGPDGGFDGGFDV